MHDYLGMTLDYSETGKVKVMMTDYVKAMLEELPVDMSGHAATPAADHLFEVNTLDPQLLDQADQEQFVQLVAKTLYLCKQARPDIQTAVAFLCT